MVRLGSIANAQTPMTYPPLNSARESRPESLGGMAHLSNLLRMAPLQLGELPKHPDLPDPSEAWVPMSRRASAEALAEVARVQSNNQPEIEGSAQDQQDPSTGNLQGNATRDSTALQKTISHPPFPQPDIQTFILALLDDGMQFLSEPNFSKVFSRQDSKLSAPHPETVDLYSYGVAMGELAGIFWSGDSRVVQRSRPRQYSGRGGDGASGGVGGGETWFARRTLHDDISSNQSNGTTASWDEFVYGLRDEHSRHEHDFTPTLYDCHEVVNWNTDLTQYTGPNPSHSLNSSSSGQKYTHISAGIFEMCHKLPFPMSPRCFSVFVTTASISPEQFIAVTVPVTLSPSVKNAFYTVGKNKKEAPSGIEKKEVVVGNYVAVEIIRVLPQSETEAVQVEKKRKESTASTNINGRKSSRISSFIPGMGSGSGNGSKQTSRKNSADFVGVDEDGAVAGGAATTTTTITNQKGSARKIEWTMATASNTRGNLPVKMQEMGIPGAIAKDVGYFLKWIKDVDRKEIEKVVL